MLCVVFSLCLAVSGYRSSLETGGGAAQGDLGFYLLLVATTPIVLLITVAGWAIARLALNRISEGRAMTPVVSSLCAASVLGVGWNWIFLFWFWR